MGEKPRENLLRKIFLKDSKSNNDNQINFSDGLKEKQFFSHHFHPLLIRAKKKIIFLCVNFSHRKNQQNISLICPTINQKNFHFSFFYLEKFFDEIGEGGVLYYLSVKKNRNPINNNTN